MNAWWETLQAHTLCGRIINSSSSSNNNTDADFPNTHTHTNCAIYSPKFGRLFIKVNNLCFRFHIAPLLHMAQKASTAAATAAASAVNALPLTQFVCCKSKQTDFQACSAYLSLSLSLTHSPRPLALAVPLLTISSCSLLPARAFALSTL